MSYLMPMLSELVNGVITPARSLGRCLWGYTISGWYKQSQVSVTVANAIAWPSLSVVHVQQALPHIIVLY